MQYYIIHNETEIYIAENPDAFANLGYSENVYELPDDYNSEKYIVVDGELILNPDYDQEQAAQREAEFKQSFFEIPNFGWFRKVPKGYSSAVESLNTAFNAVTILQKLPANMLIFYQEPDFTKPEECTEEWLIEHQIFNPEMSVQEFGTFYMAFMTAWNTQEHENAVQENNEEI